MIFTFFWWFGIITGYPLQLIFFKRKTYYEDKADYKKHKKQGAVIISNHHNVVDFGVNMFFVLPRKLYVVAAEIAFKNKLIRFGMRFFNGIQANRKTKSLSFIDESARLLKKGKLVQIFPEGHNTRGDTIDELHPTYLMMAIRGESIIIPIITDGRYNLFKRTHIYVGKAIHLSEYGLDNEPTKEKIVIANKAIHERMLELQRKLREKTR